MAVTGLTSCSFLQKLHYVVLTGQALHDSVTVALYTHFSSLLRWRNNWKTHSLHQGPFVLLAMSGGHFKIITYPVFLAVNSLLIN